jgi:Raf kinase inhibitor-like YbhB/YbcL family protein
MTRCAVFIAALGLSMLGIGMANAQNLSLTSSEVSEGGTIGNEQVFKGFGCAGGNVSPALSWSGAPTGTKSFAVSMYDPDAPTGSGFWHWVAWDIPAGTTSLPTGAELPAGSVNGENDAGTIGYTGPCPPPGDGTHHYQITVIALSVATLGLDATTHPAVVGFVAGHNALAAGQLVATAEQ